MDQIFPVTWRSSWENIYDMLSKETIKHKNYTCVNKCVVRGHKENTSNGTVAVSRSNTGVLSFLNYFIL